MQETLQKLWAKASDREVLAWAIALLGAALIAQFGIGIALENGFKKLREDAISQSATGELVIVEIDARSLQTLDSWPWPRSRYGEAVRKLNEAGVSQIAFDVDFSSHSIPAEDQAFAAAISESEATVILPTFRQSGSAGSKDEVESLPIDILAKEAFLGSVNVHPDDSGQLNRYSYGTTTAGLPRPSLASMLSGASGRVYDSFAINQAIDPATIPSVSFAELLQGQVEAERLQGKKVMIGATAIELGDRYPIRNYGVIPGVVIQAMATETLLQDAVTPDFGPFLSLIVVACLLMAAIKWLDPRWLGAACVALGLASFATLLALEAGYLATFSNIPMLFFLGAFLTLRKFFSTSFALRQSQMRNALSGLPNEASFAKFLERDQTPVIIVARIANFSDVAALTNAVAREQLFGGLSERLGFLAEGGRIFHLESNIFAWVAGQCEEHNVAEHCETAAALFQSPFMADTTKLRLNVFFGASTHSIEQAKVAADQASAKNERWAWHDDSASDAVSVQQRLLVDLENALKSGAIQTVFQPKWGFANKQIVGAEALVRWDHDEFGKVSPELFIPLLERENRIDALTLHVIDQSLDVLGEWHETRPHLSCAVNVSAPLLSDPRFVELAIDRIKTAHVDPSKITFEVTESATLADKELAVVALEQVRAAGIKVSIDDYGTGQSTLSYLQRLPADELKIDQSFVRTMVEDKGNMVLVQSTIDMAHALGFSVVAEGIETADCLAMLEGMGCDTGQGWLISKPLGQAEFSEALDGIEAELGLPKRKTA